MVMESAATGDLCDPIVGVMPHFTDSNRTLMLAACLFRITLSLKYFLNFRNLAYRRSQERIYSLRNQAMAPPD